MEADYYALVELRKMVDPGTSVDYRAGLTEQDLQSIADENTFRRAFAERRQSLPEVLRTDPWYTYTVRKG